MSKKITSEEQVKALLGIQDFRSMSKEKIIKFVSSIPNMDREVAMKCIEQFPEFREAANSMVAHLKDVCTVIIEDDRDNRRTTVQTYERILSELETQLKNPDISHREKQEIIETMINIADKIADLERDARGLRKHIIDVVAAVASFGVTVAGAILGVKFLKKE